MRIKFREFQSVTRVFGSILGVTWGEGGGAHEKLAFLNGIQYFNHELSNNGPKTQNKVF